MANVGSMGVIRQIKKDIVKNYLLLPLFLILYSFIASAHSGRTDSRGGHHDRKNGGYHYHHGMPAHQHPNGICEYASKTRKSNKSIPTLFIILGVFGFLGLIIDLWIKHDIKKIYKR